MKDVEDSQRVNGKDAPTCRAPLEVVVMVRPGAETVAKGKTPVRSGTGRDVDSPLPSRRYIVDH